MTHVIPKEVAEDIGPFLKQLADFGYEPYDSRYDRKSFGNYYVDLRAGEVWLRVVRDRRQYYIDSKSIDKLRQDGMLRAFDDRKAFERAVLAWLRAV
jgi:hypothetical protein